MRGWRCSFFVREHVGEGESREEQVVEPGRFGLTFMAARGEKLRRSRRQIPRICFASRAARAGGGCEIIERERETKFAWAGVAREVFFFAFFSAPCFRISEEARFARAQFVAERRSEVLLIG